MFRMDRNSNHQQAANETANNQPPPWPHNAPASDALYQTLPQTSTVSRAISESEALARDIKEGILTGFVGNGTVLAGEATFRGMLRIDGRLSGSIKSQDGTLIVGAGGQVDASIEVAVATVHGTINGDIIATKRIEIGRTSRVIGNIQAPTLVIEQGAIFEGNCRMIQSKEAADRQGGKEMHETDSSMLEGSDPADLSSDSAIPS
jgi:cytoskeletal protein CcmA (bactofilin family)